MSFKLQFIDNKYLNVLLLITIGRVAISKLAGIPEKNETDHNKMATDRWTGIPLRSYRH